MAFWLRITQSKLKHLSYQFKRAYLQIPHPSLLNNVTTYARRSVAGKQYWVTPKRAPDFCNSMRTFSARSKGKPEKEIKKRRMNEEITSEFVRLVTDEGHSVISRREALKRARELELDLVEVGGLVNTPACKLLDLKREKYLQQQKKKELKKKELEKKTDVTLRGGSLKEVRFNRKIEPNDLKFKADQVKKLLERGYRVKCSATVPAVYDMGRSDLVKFEDQNLKTLISRFADLLGDTATVESDHTTKGKLAFLVVRHAKFGPLKSGKKVTVSGKTAAPALGTSDSTEEDLISDEENPASDISPSMRIPQTTHSPAKPAVPEFQNSRQVIDNSSPRTNPPPQIKPPLENENRYSRKEPNNRYAPRNSMDNRGSRTRDQLQFPNDRRQPAPDSNFNRNPGASARDSARYEPRFPNQTRQPPFDSNPNGGPGMRNSGGFVPDQQR